MSAVVINIGGSVIAASVTPFLDILLYLPIVSLRIFMTAGHTKSRMDRGMKKYGTFFAWTQTKN